MWRVLVAHFTPRPRAVRLTTEQHLRAVLALPDAQVLEYNAVHGLRVSVVGTVLGDEHREELYPRLSGRAAFYELLTGYIDDAAAERMRARLVPADERPYDVVYRARRLPYW